MVHWGLKKVQGGLEPPGTLLPAPMPVGISIGTFRQHFLNNQTIRSQEAAQPQKQINCKCN